MRLWGLFKKYWDLIVGIFTGVLFSFLANWKTEKIQLIYSIIILLLVNIGLLRIIKKEIEKRQGKQLRKYTLIDKVVDSQTSVKAVELGYHPMQMGEDIGYLSIDIFKKGMSGMKKIMNLLDKCKGFLLSIALSILALVEMFGGYISQVFGDKLVVNGVNIVAVLVLGASLVVAGVSNIYDKDQKEKIKAILSKKSPLDTLAKELKDVLKTQHNELKTLNKEIELAKITLDDTNKGINAMIEDYNQKCNLNNVVPGTISQELLNEMANTIELNRKNLGELNKEILAQEVLVKEKEDSIAKVKAKLLEIKGGK